MFVFFFFFWFLPLKMYSTETELFQKKEFQTAVLNGNTENCLKLFLSVDDEQKPEFLRFQSNRFILRLLYDLYQDNDYLKSLLEKPKRPFFFYERKYLPLVRQVLKERFILRGGLPLNL